MVSLPDVFSLFLHLYLDILYLFLFILLFPFTFSSTKNSFLLLTPFNSFPGLNDK